MGHVQHLWVPGVFPNLNELIDARTQLGARAPGTFKRHSDYSDLKRDWAHRVVLCARSQRIKPVPAAYFTYLLYEPNKRRNPSNVAAAVVKIIEDALQAAGIIANDGWREVLGFSSYWELDKGDPGVAVFLSSHNVLDRTTAIHSDRTARKKDAPARPRATDHEPLQEADRESPEPGSPPADRELACDGD